MSIFNRIYNRFFSKKSDVELELEYLQKRGMTVGKNTTIYSAGTFDHIYPHLISIGDNSLISTNVTILTHDGSTLMAGCGSKVGMVRIGSNVFVGTGSTILCDVTIGDNVVIGAGSVVTKSLPGGAVYAGVPAKRICSFEEFKTRNEKLRKERMDLAHILPWYAWEDAPPEKREEMKEALKDGFAFI